MFNFSFAIPTTHNFYSVLLEWFVITEYNIFVFYLVFNVNFFGILIPSGGRSVKFK